MLCYAVGWMVGQSVGCLSLNSNGIAYLVYCSCPNSIVTFSSTVPAHPHATGLAVYLASFVFIGLYFQVNNAQVRSSWIFFFPFYMHAWIETRYYDISSLRLLIPLSCCLSEFFSFRLSDDNFVCQSVGLSPFVYLLNHSIFSDVQL